MEKNCKYCGEPFTAKRSTAEYCSNSHRVMAFRGSGGTKGGGRLTEIATKLFKYMSEKSATKEGLWELMKSFVPPVLEMDTRPVDPKIFDVSKEREITPEKTLVLPKPSSIGVGGIVAPREITTDKEIDEWMKSVMKTPKINFSPITEKSYDGSDIDRTMIDEMPMWTPKPKTEKVQTKAETERFAAAEMKRLAELQERAAKLKGGKKK